jgi:hypothetical protein
MTGSGEGLVIRTVTGEELMGRRPWCPSSGDVAWLAHGANVMGASVIVGRHPFRTRDGGVNDDARLDLALELTFPASDPVALSSWEGEMAPGDVDVP